MKNERPMLTARAVSLRAVFMHLLDLTIAGMAAYWSPCAKQRRCLESP